MTAVFVGSVATPLALMTCLRYATSQQNRLHFLGLSCTSHRQRMLSVKDLLCIRMSSKYTRQVVHGKTRSTSSMSLKGRWCIAEAKWYESSTNGERSLLLVHFVHLHLSVATFQVQGVEPRTGEGLKSRVNMWQRVRVLPSQVIQQAIVNTKTHRAVLLLNHDNG